MQDPPMLSDLNITFQNFIAVILSFAGIVLFILLLLGGFKYISSGGNPESAARARATITYAIAGLLVLASAYLILALIENITGAKITSFSINR